LAGTTKIICFPHFGALPADVGVQLFGGRRTVKDLAEIVADDAYLIRPPEPAGGGWLVERLR
jgi:hypothetical protein